MPYDSAVGVTARDIREHVIIGVQKKRLKPGEMMAKKKASDKCVLRKY